MPRKISTTRTGNSGLVKDGIYLLQIVDSEETVSSSGNDMVKLKLAIVRGGRASGRTMLDNLVFSEAAQWKFDNLHDALEVEEGKDIDYRYYKGKKVYASVISEEYNGNINNKVKTYLNQDMARTLLEKQVGAEQEDDSEDAPSFEETRTPVAASGSPVRGRKRQAVAELEEDDSMPL